ncbi:MAG: hypothetical protein IPQ09_02860 [Myxococcales bacterium]|nr:hypothetical protein [Myxococcales bacterium]HQY63347.1 YtfJ family protein [Polyangiaceae bacterium]
MTRPTRRPLTTLALATAAALALALAVAAPAAALPSAGAARPAVQLVDGWDRPFVLPRAHGKPVLVVYEDKDSAQQNQAFKDELAKLGKGDRYKQSVTLVAIADLQGYDYWPVRGFVKDAIQSESNKFGTPIYCDWSGAARNSLRLKKGVSSVLLYDREGKLVFSHEGPMPAAKRQAAIELLRDAVAGARS